MPERIQIEPYRSLAGTVTEPKPKPDRTGAGTPRRPPLGRWLVDNMPRGADLDSPGGRESVREIPFAEGEAE